MSWLVIGSGIVIVLLALTDVFLTVFHPTAHAGPVTRVQSRIVWRLTRWVGGCGGSRRDRLLTLGGPVIAALTPVAWIVFLILGFALIHWPFVLDFSFDPGPPGARWVEALYYSGYLAVTLGLGDVVPMSGTLRILAVIEAMAGFGVFTMGVTYVLSVYTQQSMQTTLANDIDHALRGASPLDWRDPDDRELAWAGDLARDFAHRLARVTTANRQYPILHFFRHRNPREALPVQIGRVIRWVQAMEDAPEADWFRGRSPFLSLRRALDDYMEEVPGFLLPEEGMAGSRDRNETYARVLEYLCYDPIPAAQAGVDREE